MATEQKAEKGASKSDRELLRHTLATLAYRGAKALGGAPVDFSFYDAGGGTRTPGQILAHLCDLFDWAVSIAEGRQKWHESEPGAWEDDSARFFAALERLDNLLASDALLHCSVDGLFQAPVADALTHIGQISLLRRLAGVPVRPENYFVADIVAGRVGAKQTPPKREF
jgi:hypothetical protein